jgi:hypothetical protein
LIGACRRCVGDARRDDVVQRDHVSDRRGGF